MNLRTRLVVLAAVAISLSACGNAADPNAAAKSDDLSSVAAKHVEGLPRTPAAVGASRETARPDDLDDLVMLSDLVIVGTVVAEAPGRTAGSGVGGQIQMRESAIVVEEVMAGDFTGATLTLEELGWMNGVPGTLNHATWAKQGDRILVALTRTENSGVRGDGLGIGGPTYILRHSSARFYLRPTGDVEDNYSEDNETPVFARDAAALSVEDLLDSLRALH